MFGNLSILSKCIKCILTRLPQNCPTSYPVVNQCEVKAMRRMIFRVNRSRCSRVGAGRGCARSWIMRRRIQVQVGQRYFQDFVHGSHNQIWEVASIYSEGEWIPHARLVNVSNPSETKTLSCTALDDQRSFRLLNV